MANGTLVRARLNILYLLIFVLPGLSALPSGVSNWKRYTYPIVSTTYDGDLEVCGTWSICKIYPYKILSNPDGKWTTRKDEFDDDVLYLETSKKRYLKYSIGELLFSFLFLATGLYLFIYNRIILTAEELIIRVFVPVATRFVHFPIHTRYNWNVNGNERIMVSSIRGLNVITKTPLIKIKNSLSQVNWRDEIELLYMDSKGTERIQRFNVFLFPSLKKLLLKLVEIKSDVTITFSKTTAIQNLKELQIPPLS